MFRDSRIFIESIGNIATLIMESEIKAMIYQINNC